MLSRRELVRLCGPLLMSPPIGCLARENSDSPGTPLILSKEFARASMVALSPDGRELCLEDWGERGYPLRVLDVDTGRSIYSGHFQSRTLGASFFGDGKKLFVQSFASTSNGRCGSGVGHCRDAQTVVDIWNGERVEKDIPLYTYRGERCYALRNGVLLDAHYDYAGKPHRTETLALVDLPDYRERTKVPYATQPPGPLSSGVVLGTEYGFAISDDRETLAYAFDDVLAVRRTHDLGVIWTRRMQSQLKPYSVVISSFGTYVAAALADSAPPKLQRESYISVYDGTDGRELTRLPRNGTSGLAISPDGKLVAAVVLAGGKKGEVVPTVQVYSLSSGELLASVVHDHIRSGRHQFLNAGCVPAFTSNGKYLVTSAMTTKVWKLGE
jgi:hypothetical protein